MQKGLLPLQAALPAHVRYHEYFRIEDDRVVEMQAVWDIPELMMQAPGQWPHSWGLICVRPHS